MPTTLRKVNPKILILAGLVAAWWLFRGRDGGDGGSDLEGTPLPVEPSAGAFGGDSTDSGVTETLTALLTTQQDILEAILDQDPSGGGGNPVPPPGTGEAGFWMWGQFWTRNEYQAFQQQWLRRVGNGSFAHWDRWLSTHPRVAAVFNLTPVPPQKQPPKPAAKRGYRREWRPLVFKWVYVKVPKPGSHAPGPGRWKWDWKAEKWLWERKGGLPDVPSGPRKPDTRRAAVAAGSPDGAASPALVAMPHATTPVVRPAATAAYGVGGVTTTLSGAQVRIGSSGRLPPRRRRRRRGGSHMIGASR